jgi:hypothetical protein
MKLLYVITVTALAMLLTCGNAVASMYTVDLNSKTGAPQDIDLAAGTYEIHPLDGTYVAWNPWGYVSLPDNGYVYSYSYDIGVTRHSFSLPDGTKLGTAQEALAHAQSQPRQTFSLAQPSTVSFLITDSHYSDNIGGVSLGVQAVNNVPVPAAAWLLASGFFGLAGLRRKRLL